jgi:hypothetical protein
VTTSASGGWVVEQPIASVTDAEGNVLQGAGVARVYVATEQRAKEIVQQGADALPPVVRTYREIPLDEMPAKARDNLLASRAPE